MADILVAITELIGLEKRVEILGGKIIESINKEKNAKKRKKMLRAYKHRDSAALRDLWFGRK